ncbi:hypothetical protein HMPREF1399_01031 [Helicobacter pylori GAM118Bi]|uniref:hypothetical protein n=1 Tax=Helicobacter pylori TaxID=210 RepID=UPI0002BC692D|nr:hypothetical protein [Helicobacter pylori]EMG92951.1 hypothetical protein HMPREF1399_01031 [Helicobacter pylori GAM118Bi]
MGIKGERKWNNLLTILIKANPGKSLHQETQQANEDNDTKQSVSETAKANSNETNTTRIFICVVIFFLAIILLAVFLRKGGYQLSNNQRIDAKNPSHKNYKKMITTAPNRLTPNNLKYKMAKVKVRKNGDKNPPF